MTTPFDMNVYAAPQRLIKVEPGRRLNLFTMGEGRPAVILATGAGGGTIHWWRVQPALAERTQVVSYDRAGLGFSDAGPLPATPSRAVSDLRKALRQAGIAPPYVLVGASRGALEVRLFAFLHPDEVAGLVLVDPSKEEQSERFRAAAPDASVGLGEHMDHLRHCAECAEDGRLIEGTEDYAACVAPPNPRLSVEVNKALRDAALRPAFWRTMLSEYETVRGKASDELLASRRSLEDLPLIVLTRGLPEANPLPPDQSAAFERVSKAMHAELAAESSRGVLRTVEGASHMINFERPEAIVEAVFEVIASLAEPGQRG